MSHQQQPQTGPVVPPEATAALPFVTNGHRNAPEELARAFTEFRPLAILISEEERAASSVIREFLDGIGGDVAVARVPAGNSNAIAGMREITRAIGFDPKHMNIGEMENVFTMFLSYQMAHDRRTIICVDETPDNAQWVLDRVQHLVKLESEGKCGLMVILSGRAGLNESIKEHPLDALASEVAMRISTVPSVRDETQESVPRRSGTGDNADGDQLSERHPISFLHKFRRRVPDAVKKIYVKWLHVASKEKSNGVTAGAVKKVAQQGRPEPLIRLSDLPEPTLKVNGESPAVGRLILHMDDEIIQAEVLKKGHILIGRSKMCDLRVMSDKISRHHAMVVNSANGTDLVDLRSKNGTFVDGRPIERHPLRDSDAFSIGGCIIRYIADDGR